MFIYNSAYFFMHTDRIPEKISMITCNLFFFPRGQVIKSKQTIALLFNMKKHVSVASHKHKAEFQMLYYF